MNTADESWVARARAVPIQQEIERRHIKLHGAIDRCGPCPKCGGADRFSINTKKQCWNCRGCAGGGDVIALVQHLDSVDFIGACTTLAGQPPPKNEQPVKKVVAEEHHYPYEDGKLAFVVKRIEYQKPDGAYVTRDGKRKKTFSRCRPDPNKPGGWIYNVDGIPPLLYRLPEVIAAVANEQPILMVEGERKVDRLWSLNVPATCNAGGAEKSETGHAEPLTCAHVIILPDNDTPGQRHVEVVARSLADVAASIRVLKLPGLKPKGDVIDWLNDGGTVEELHRLIDQEAKFWTPTAQDLDPPRSPEHSDDALALEFAGRHGADARFIAHRGKWLFWTSSVWLIDETLRAFDYARAICRDIAASCDAPTRAAALASAKTVAAVERLAKADRCIAATTEQWDAEADVINAPTALEKP
jgi:putative DNA primase/helicase